MNRNDEVHTIHYVDLYEPGEVTNYATKAELEDDWENRTNVALMLDWAVSVDLQPKGRCDAAQS